ncbi:hypothetical protein F5884DRAFT_818401 [Xylogone sp. PMI_703]|nr:hypothetical protein F5884DRAFT_818401 [Xylogone sp. PMI_703]
MDSKSPPGQGNVQPPATGQSPQDCPRSTVSAACIACRSKHLKCDGLNPCSRCSSDNTDCIYVRSRRGYKGPRKAVGQRKALPPSTDLSRITCPLIRAPFNSKDLQQQIQNGLNLSSFQGALADPSFFDFGQDLAGTVSGSSHLIPDVQQRCMEAFFHYFAPAHPFMLPKLNLLKLLKEKPLGYIEAILWYIGSIYISEAPTAAFEQEAERLVNLATSRDGFKVQALLLLAIAFDGCLHRDRALQFLLEAQDLALELGMDKREFASANGQGCVFLEESWRRTFWELYAVDGMIAGVHQKSEFRFYNVESDVPLPCEEVEYTSGTIPPSSTLDDFDDSFFDGRDINYSSSAYRIVAIRNIGRVMALGKITFQDDPSIDRVESYIVNWWLHLPASKKSMVSRDGRVDEMLFQAMMVAHAATIILHRDHSQLDSAIAQNVTSCAPHHQIIPGPSYNIHAAKVIEAAQAISKLITLPTPIVKHTHFFVCAITLASIIHLSCWSLQLPQIQDRDIKEQLRLSSGGLQELRKVWPAAGISFAQVKGVAQELYAAKKAAAELALWTPISDDDMMRSIIEDQSIMEDMQLL